MRARAFTPGDIVRQILVMAILVVFMFPIFWMLMTSFKSYGDILVSPPRWVFEPTLNNYFDAFQKANFAHYIINTHRRCVVHRHRHPDVGARLVWFCALQRWRGQPHVLHLDDEDDAAHRRRSTILHDLQDSGR